MLDTLGGEAHVRSQQALKQGGVLVALSATPVPAHAPRTDVRSQFRLDDAHPAYAASEAGHGKGKIVLQIS